MKRSRGFWVEDYDIVYDEPKTATVVHEADQGPEFSGLYDADGNKLYRPRIAFGFQGKMRS